MSYHFRGKQDLLIEAALDAFQRVIPAEEFAELTTVEDLIGMIAAELGDLGAPGSVLSRVMFEAMREPSATRCCASGWPRCSSGTGG